jgi:iron complex transport system ATP-binding protein
MSIQAEHLAYGYGRRIVGEDVSLALAGGEVVCLLGPNGGGKTTLLKTLLGLLPAKGGRILLDGRALDRWSERERATRIAYVPQAASFYFPFSVRDVVLMGRAPRIGTFGVPSGADRDVAERCMALLGIDALADRRCDEISGGERQLALIARAMAQEPRVLVMDEPGASLDFGNRLRLLGHIRALAARGVAILFSTHAPDEAFAAADRVLLLAGGKPLTLGAPADVITPANLHRLYGVHVEAAYLDNLRRIPSAPPQAGDPP